MYPSTGSLIAFQGGGFLGYFSACVAAQLSQSTNGVGNSLFSSFDMFAGTSVGSIIAVALAAGIDPTDVSDVMSKKGPDIFPARRYFHTTPGFLRARFSAIPLRDALTKILGDKKLGDLDRALLVPSVNETRGCPEIFRSYDLTQKDISLVDVVMASTAAPTYFPRHQIGEHFYVDGGLVANGPALLASRDMSDIFGIPVANQRVLTIGTTKAAASQEKHSTAASWGVMDWVWPRRRLLDLLLSGQIDVQTDLLTKLNPLCHIHIDCELPPEDARQVHIVEAGSDAQSILEKAAIRAMQRIPPEHRFSLEMMISRRARRMVFKQFPGANEPCARFVDY